MVNIPPILLKDGYKVGHYKQYPDDTTMIYSNLTPRKSRVEGCDGVVCFGPQYFVEEYLVRQFATDFFELPKDVIMKYYKRRINYYLGEGAITFDHIEALHDLGYLPLLIKAIPEGMLVPFRVPLLTIRNTKPEFFWLTNMLETLLSNILWLPCTSATTALAYRRTFERYAKLTGADKAFIQWQGHDFSFRGMAGIEAALLSAAGHLLSFTGTDTIPAIDFLEEYYGADCEKELIGGSVAATEHSVMSMGMKAGELATIKRLITKVVPKGIISIVGDTWDFWKVLTEYWPALKAEILARDGKVVVRPDSGDPVKIICGDRTGTTAISDAERRGAVQVLWDTFGGTNTLTGHRVLDPHVGLIYGDSITLERQQEILQRLEAQGFASSNVVLGIGSYTYQHVTRDTHGFAMKATYGERGTGLNTVRQDIYKDPKTDDGTKKSAMGLLAVETVVPHKAFNEAPHLVCYQQVTWSGEARGYLQTIFDNGTVKNVQTLAQIRDRVKQYY